MKASVRSRATSLWRSPMFGLQVETLYDAVETVNGAQQCFWPLNRTLSPRAKQAERCWRRRAFNAFIPKPRWSSFANVQGLSSFSDISYGGNTDLVWDEYALILWGSLLFKPKHQLVSTPTSWLMQILGSLFILNRADWLLDYRLYSNSNWAVGNYNGSLSPFPDIYRKNYSYR